MPCRVEAGTSVTYTVTVTNNGPAGAGNLTFKDAVPTGTNLVSFAAASGWNCTSPTVGSSGAIACSADALNSGSAAKFLVVADVNCSVPNGTVIDSTASAAAGTPPDSNLTNNSQKVSLTVSNPVPVVHASVAQPLLRQNDHELVNVGLAATAIDTACPAPTTFAVQVFGNEDDQTSTSGDDAFSPDARDIGVGSLRLRAERLGNSDGRVYLIIVKATDTAGGTGFDSVTVVVPKSSSAASRMAIAAEAMAAEQSALANNGVPPAGYLMIGDGPPFGPKQ